MFFILQFLPIHLLHPCRHIREPCPPLVFAAPIQGFQRFAKGFPFSLRQFLHQPGIKYGFNRSFGVFQFLGLGRGIQQLAAAIVRVRFAHQVALGFQAGRTAGGRPLINLQGRTHIRLGHAGVVAYQMNKIKLCRANAIGFHHLYGKLGRFPRNFGHLPLGRVLVLFCLHVWPPFQVGCTINHLDDAASI